MRKTVKIKLSGLIFDELTRRPFQEDRIDDELQCLRIIKRILDKYKVSDSRIRK